MVIRCTIHQVVKNLHCHHGNCNSVIYCQDVLFSFLPMIFTPQGCPCSRRPNGMLMETLPEASLVFYFLSPRKNQKSPGSHDISPSGCRRTVCLPPHQVQLRERCFSSSQDGITHNCHLYLLFPPPNLGPEPHILVSHSIFFSAGVILCPASLSGLACSATPFLNQAEFLHSELPYIPLYGIYGPKTVPTGVWKLTDPQKNYFTLKCLLAASLVDNTFNQKGKGEGRGKRRNPLSE